MTNFCVKCGKSEGTEYVIVLSNDQDPEILTEKDIVDIGYLCGRCRVHFATLPHYKVMPAIKMDD